MARTVAIGYQSYQELIEKNAFYVDKTLFIPASNESSGCLQTFDDCREGQIPRSLLRGI